MPSTRQTRNSNSAKAKTTKPYNRTSTNTRKGKSRFLQVGETDPSSKKARLDLIHLIAKRDYISNRIDEIQQTLNVEGDKDPNDIDKKLLHRLRNRLEQHLKEVKECSRDIQASMDGDELIQDITEHETVIGKLRDATEDLGRIIGSIGKSKERTTGGQLRGSRSADFDQRVETGAKEGRSAWGHLRSRRSADLDQLDDTNAATAAVDLGQRAQTPVADLGQRVNVKLPKLEIPKYDGSLSKWQTFWDIFKSTIHMNDSLTDVEKFQYLLSQLTGSALRAVEGIKITNAQYKTAIDILQKRFGDPQKVINSYFDSFMKLQTPSLRTSDLRMFLDEMEKHIRSLEALNLPENTYAMTFVPMILSKLPSQVKLEISRKHGDQAWNLDALRQLLNDEIAARENCIDNLHDGKYNDGKRVSDYRRFNQPTTASTLTSNSQRSGKGITTTGPNRKCHYCRDKQHYSDECPKYSTLESRKRRLGYKRCFKCLGIGHTAPTCNYHRCPFCTGNHHRSLCSKKFSNTDKAKDERIIQIRTTSMTASAKIEPSENTGIRQVTLLASNQRTIMPTAIAMVESTNRNTKSLACHLILDTASQRSYITQALADKLQLRSFGSEKLDIGTFGSNSSNQIEVPATAIRIRTKKGIAIDMTVNVMPTISVPIRKENIDIGKFAFVENLDLAEPLNNQPEDIHLDMLIGSDYYNDIVDGRRLKLDNGLYAIHSIFGWIISGRINTSDQQNDTTSSSSATMLASTYISPMTPTDDMLERFWNLEAIGIKEDGLVKDDDIALKKVMDSITFEEGRYYVSWPWKDPTPDLPRNYELALGRLKSLQRKMQDQSELHMKYEQVIQQQLRDGIIEEIDPTIEDGPVHYLPHHGIAKDDAVSTKLRIVYDASAKTHKKANSLNDCLYRGPVLLEDLCGLLLRFRTYPIGILSDIEKAFLMIGLHKSERDVTRFLWRDAMNNLKTYRFCRVPFGIISSPFLLAATVTYHLKKSGTEIANKIMKNIYVDNVCTGVDSVSEAEWFYNASKGLFKEASMNLREWCSNSKEFIDKLPSNDKLTGTDLKVLGLTWNTELDSLAIRKFKIDDTTTLTKRKLLAIISSPFDPLGLFSPIELKAKILIQTIWKLKLDWDTPLPESICQQWLQILPNLRNITDLHVPRFIGITNSLSHESVKVEIHCFCDASTTAYAACIYLKVLQHNTVVVNLLVSKSRLAPVKTLTIPRLELMAVLIGVRLLKFVETQLNIQASGKYLWTDSKCVLYWIASTTLKAAFVERRLHEIRADPQIQFRYIASKENPADIPTKGITIDELKNCSLWWEGPTWLKNQNIEWPLPIDFSSKTGKQYDMLEARKAEVSLPAPEHSTIDSFTLLLERCQLASKLWRITAYVLRAYKKFRKLGINNGPPTVTELTSARMLWIKRVQHEVFGEELRLLQKGSVNGLIKQLNLYVDDNELIRCKGRLAYANIDDLTNNPILLPKGHRFSELIVQDLHLRLKHSGVRHIICELRQNYWIPCARRFIRSVIRRCTICRRIEGGPFKPPIAPDLPKERILEAPAFTFVGIDYLGPLLVKNEVNNSIKIWICLFTCAVTRAIHLEVAPSLSTEHFLEILRRFISRRGKPKVIISDNARQFKLANSVLLKAWYDVIQDDIVQSYIANEGMEWKFITELSPWMGGFYERLVGLVKRSLRKTIGNRLLNFRQLETLMIEIEAVLNARPLGFVGSDMDDVNVLTPSMFLGTGRLCGVPILSFDEDPDFRDKVDSVQFLIEKWQKEQKLLNDFWKRFKTEYLTHLREYRLIKERKGMIPQVPYIGQPVLIRDDLPRGHWKLGIIDKLHSGSDGAIRSAGVRIKGKKLIQRPIALLYPLEYVEEQVQADIPGSHNENTKNHAESANSSAPAFRRSTRKAAERAKSNITNLFRRECHALHEDDWNIDE